MFRRKTPDPVEQTSDFLRVVRTEAAVSLREMRNLALELRVLSVEIQNMAATCAPEEAAKHG